MPWRYESSEALCPYYRMEDSRSIWCEGIDPGGSLQVTSASGKQAAIRKARFCRADWQKCYIAQALTKKYEDSEKKSRGRD